MTGLIVHMVREFIAAGKVDDRIVHARVFPSGEIEMVRGEHNARAVREITVVRDHRAWAGSQLLTIRHLALMGWRVTDPSLWEEAEF